MRPVHLDFQKVYKSHQLSLLLLNMILQSLVGNIASKKNIRITKWFENKNIISHIMTVCLGYLYKNVTGINQYKAHFSF